MEILSTNHLVECMQETMEPTQRRLMYLFPIIRRESPPLCNYLQKYVVCFGTYQSSGNASHFCILLSVYLLTDHRLERYLHCLGT